MPTAYCRMLPAPVHAAAMAKGAKDSREAELKFEIDRRAARKLRRHPLLSETDPKTQSLTSIYFDTEKGRVHKAGYSLRVRQSGDDHVQTVKTNGGAGLFDRGEWEVPVDALELDTKALEATPLGNLNKLKKKLEPHVRSTAKRASWIIDHGGSLIEVVLDRGTVEACNEKQKFQELELELRDGALAGLFSLARQLADDVPLEIGVLSKEERGMLLAEGAFDREQKAREPAISDEMSVRQAFIAVVQECIRHFRLNQALVTTKRDPAALHQSRVAMRRLRTVFTLFGPAIRRGTLAPLKSDLKAFTVPFGVARNLDVYLDRHGEELGWRDRRKLQSARADAYDQVIDALNSRQKRDMLVDLAEWTSGADWQRDAADEPIGEFAAGQLEVAWRKMKRGASQLGELDEQQLHRLRINIKKLRYSAEFLGPLYRRKSVRKFAHSLEAMQDCLGLIHDDMISREIVAQYALDESSRTDISRRSRQLTRMAKRFKDLKHAGPYWR